MTIGIYLEQLIPGKIGGAEQYTRNLIQRISEMNYKMVLFLNEEARNTFQCTDNVSLICISIHDKIQQKSYDFYCQFYEIDVLFCPLLYVPHVKFRIPVVVTIHDLQFKYFPEYFTKENLCYREKETIYAIEQADKIITISEHAKKTIIEQYGIQESCIKVIYEDADTSIQYSKKTEMVCEQLKNINSKYIFYPAASWKHKNHRKLFQALVILIQEFKLDLSLVLTGNIEEPLKLMIEEYKLEDRVVALGYVNQELMNHIFANAQLLVFPSLFEGFGIPLIEAMQMELPIVCSNCGSIPEIAGDAAEFFDPMNEKEIAQVVFNTIVNDERRRELIEKGKIRRKIFSWDICAKQTIEILQDVSNNRKIEKKNFQLENMLVIFIWDNGCKQDIDTTIKSLKSTGIEKYEYIIITEKNVNNKIAQIDEDKVIGFINAGDTFTEEILLFVNLYFQEITEMVLCGKLFDTRYKEFEKLEGSKVLSQQNKEMDYVCKQVMFIRCKELLGSTIMLNGNCYFYQYQLRIFLEQKATEINMINHIFAFHNHDVKPTNIFSLKRKCFWNILLNRRFPLIWMDLYMRYLSESKKKTLMLFVKYLMLWNREKLDYLMVYNDLE
ncbi:MAG: glycosyltransferase family 1 protein [Eubacteriales bacterium]